MGPQTHGHQVVESVGWREFQVVQEGQQEDGDGGEGQGQRQVFAFFEGWRLHLRCHAEVHDAHVGHQQPRKEPFGVEDGPREDDGAQHGQAGARFDALVSASKFRNSHQKDGEEDVQPRSAVGGLSAEPLIDTDPVAEQVGTAERQQRDVDHPSASDLRDEHHVWDHDHAQHPRDR